MLSLRICGLGVISEGYHLNCCKNTYSPTGLVSHQKEVFFFDESIPVLKVKDWIGVSQSRKLGESTAYSKFQTDAQRCRPITTKG